MAVHIHVHDNYGRRPGERMVEYLNHYRKDHPEATMPDMKIPVVWDDLRLIDRESVRIYTWGDHIFIGGSWDTWYKLPAGQKSKNRWRSDQDQLTLQKAHEGAAPVVSFEVVGNATTDFAEVMVWDANRQTRQSKTQIDTYNWSGIGGSHQYGEEPVPYAYLRLRFFRPQGDATPIESVYRFRQSDYGTATLDPNGGSKVTVVTDFYGMSRTYELDLRTFDSVEHRTQGHRGTWDYRTSRTNGSNGLAVLVEHLTHSNCPDGADAWWQRFFNYNASLLAEITKDDAGLSATLKKKTIKPLIDRLSVEAPLEYQFLRFLQCSKTVSKVNNNRLLATFLTDRTYDQIVTGLRYARTVEAVLKPEPSKDSWRWSTTRFSTSEGYRPDGRGKWHDFRTAVCQVLPGAQEKLDEQASKRDWTKRKGNGAQADGLGITAAEFPLLRAAIEAGKVPLGVFQQPDKQPVNREFPLWEKSLARKGWADVIYEIAEDAARRGTYERDITSYLMFLFKIETYLKRHTGKKWTAFPKYVQSENELDMDVADPDTGTVKTRSAFTPIADNEKNTVVVPYVAVRVSGVRTQWCYAQYYHIFEEGFWDPISKGIVLRDLEPKLNGRDDYGLCFYTLNGTDTATGYPTFLIIFEKLPKRIRVHFHRVRPQRTKDGVRTQTCNLIEACYQYMAGNIPASEITAQQGDLIFIRHPNDPITAGAKVEDAMKGHSLEFESHKLISQSVDGVLNLYRSAAKQPANRLGFLWAPAGLKVDHPEHDNINNLDPGWWEIRRCRSWEANPRAIWSLTID
jgi:hypothetical protein